MISFRLALAIGASLLATTPASSVYIQEWSVDPITNLDSLTLLSRLMESLTEAKPASSSSATDLPPPVRIIITAAEYSEAQTQGLVIRCTDLEADRTVRSTIRLSEEQLINMDVVVAALVTDLNYLQAAHVGFPPPPDAPPNLTHAVEGKAIAGLLSTIRQAAGHEDASETVSAEILDIAAHDRGVSVLLDGGSIDLGPRFELNSVTTALLLLTAKLPMGITTPHEISRTRWAYDMLTLEPTRSLVLLRNSSDGKTSSLNLPAGGRRLDAVPGGGMTAITNEGPIYIGLNERNLKLHPVPVAARFITAMDTDRHRRLVLYDAYDRRIVIASLDGLEIDSIRPWVEPQLLPFPHAIAVLADGSILLGGASTVWAFDRIGRPRWLLSRFHAEQEVLPSQFLLESTSGGTAFYLLDGPRARVLRFDSKEEAAPSVITEETAIELTVQLAAVALSDAISARDSGNLTEAAGLSNLAAELYRHSLNNAPDNQGLREGLGRAIDIRVDVESVVFQEHFLRIDPKHLVIANAEPGTPLKITLSVINTSSIARTGVRLLTTGLDLSVGSIQPGERVTKVLTISLPENLIATRESIALDIGVMISADEPGRARRRRMFVTLPVLVLAPPWNQT